MREAKIEGGEYYTVPIGLTVHCMKCSAKLVAGDRCYIEDDSSSIFCLKHIPKPRVKVGVIEEARRPRVPRRKWAVYE